MRVIYYGLFSDFGGHGVAARGNLDVLNYLNIDYINLDINKLGNQEYQEEVNKARQWVDEGVDFFIMHKTPMKEDLVGGSYKYLPGFIESKQKIYLTVFETDKWPYSWLPCLQEFDKIVTFSTWQHRAAVAMLRENNNHIPVYSIPHYLNTNKKRENFKNKNHIFYSEFSRILYRKGIDKLLAAYHYEFNEKDNVELRIKIPSLKEDKEEFYKILNDIKNNTYNRPLIKINHSFLDDWEMDNLYKEVNSYICTARGEGFSLPCANAAILGCNVIAPDLWASEYLDNPIKVNKNDLKTVINSDFNKFDLNIDTSKMKWYDPDVSLYQMEMRRAVNGKYKPSNKINNLSLENVSNGYKKVFNL